MTARKKLPAKEKLLDNSRFYIVASSVAISSFIFFFMRISVIDPTLRGIRLQQIYALLAVLYWYFVLLISAVAKLVKKSPGMERVLFTRRAFGCIAAYFALLHAAITFFAQLGGWHGIGLLSTEARWSVILGAAALLVLLVMTVLSVDKIVQRLKFTHWKALARAGYLAGIASIVHVWIIGTHVSYSYVQIAAFVALVALFKVQSWQLARSLQQKRYSRTKAWVLALLMFVILVSGLVAMKLFVASYSKQHSGHRGAAGEVIHAH